MPKIRRIRFGSGVSTSLTIGLMFAGLGVLAACAATRGMPIEPGFASTVRAEQPAPERDVLNVPRPSLENDEANPRLMAGLERRELSVKGRKRVFFVHRPDGLSAPAPLLFQLHGGNGTAPRRAQQTGLNEIADRERFIAIYPQGENYGWNDGRFPLGLVSSQGKADDVAFFNAMFDALTSSGEGDPARVYVSGGSNGGMMTYRLVCEVGHRIAAAVVMVANLPELVAPNCNPPRAVPLLIMNGTSDPLMPFEGGVVAMREENGRVISTMDTVEFWRKANGCAGKALQTQMPNRDPDDGMTTDMFHWAPCASGGELLFFRMNGAGHGLPGRSRNKIAEAERLGGKSSNDFDSSEETWTFLERFSLR